MLTVDLVARTLPTNLKKAATQHLVDQLNNISSDPDIAAAMRENFLSYTKVMQEGRFKLEDYLNAVKFVTYRLMEYTAKDAYIRTFPQRYQDLVASGADEKTVSSYVAMYTKGKLVNLIMEQTAVPTWVLNQDLHQKAINHLGHLMISARSELVQATAANSLLTHLKRPEAIGPGINIHMPENSGMNEMKDMLAKLAKQQAELIKNGVTTKDIAGQRLIEGEATVVEEGS